MRLKSYYIFRVRQKFSYPLVLRTSTILDLVVRNPRVLVQKALLKTQKQLGINFIACENIRFSSLFASGDVSPGGMFATQRQKFILMTQINVYIINNSGRHGVPKINLSSFMCLLVGFGNCFVYLSTSSSKTQILLEKTIFQKY